jgi:hypothetical protein
MYNKPSTKLNSKSSIVYKYRKSQQEPNEKKKKPNHMSIFLVSSLKPKKNK